MGADAKRKELRRQKFGQMHKAPSSSRGTGKESHLASTTRKLRPDALFPTPESTSQFEGNCQEVETPRDDLKSTPRFICFIGNLPFTATTKSIMHHFNKVKPNSVRLPTAKDSCTPKGYAFLEFDSHDRMQICLRSYHHSNFEDGLSVARRINVELTAGGGGPKSTGRRSRLRSKNQKLEKERRRKTTEGSRKSKTSTSLGRQAGDCQRTVEIDIHPSRRKMMSDPETV